MGHPVLFESVKIYVLCVTFHYQCERKCEAENENNNWSFKAETVLVCMKQSDLYAAVEVITFTVVANVVNVAHSLKSECLSYSATEICCNLSTENSGFFETCDSNFQILWKDSTQRYKCVCIHVSVLYKWLSYPLQMSESHSNKTSKSFGQEKM